MKLYGDGKEHDRNEVLMKLGLEFCLSDAEMAEMLPSGRQGRFDNRVAWSKSHLKQAGVFESAGRGLHRITKRGFEVLKKSPARIDIKFLDQFDEYKAFRARSMKKETDISGDSAVQESTPEELLDAGYKQLRGTLAAELLGGFKSEVQRIDDRLRAGCGDGYELRNQTCRFRLLFRRLK